MQETDVAKEVLTRVDGIGEALKKLAIELKVPAELLFEVMCVREVVTGATQLVIGLTLTIGSAVAVAKGVRRLGKNDCDGTAMGMVMVGGIIGVVCLMWLAADASNAICRIFSPEVFAIERIMESLK